MARHVKTGDTVMVTAGNNKGQTGKVISVDTDKDRVIVQGINVRKKFLKPTQQRPQGGEITKEMLETTAKECHRSLDTWAQDRLWIRDRL